jgi:hypothetical protein
MLRIRQAVVVVVGTLALAVPLLVAYALLARFALHGPVTGESLHVSVSDQAGSAPGFDRDRCERASVVRQWRCSVSDSSGSGGAFYSVTVHASNSCWSGVLLDDHSESADMRKTIHGCVRRWQWTLLDALD